MDRSPNIRRYALYGEGSQTIGPEFVHIETISARSSQHQWTISPHVHPGIFQILLLTAGHGEMLADATRTPLQPVSLMIVPCGSVHAFRFAEGAQGWVLSVANALLHDARLAPFVVDAPFATGAPQAVWRDDPDDAATGRLAWLLADLAARGNAGAAQVGRPALVAQLGLILALAAEMLANGAERVRQASGRDQLVARFRLLVEARYAQRRPIAAYAAALATTQPTLTRATRSVLGLSPGEVVQDRLLLEAMRLLTFTSSSIAQIADRLGFDDPAYFARFFKARAGCTASAFRTERRWLGRS